MRPAPVSHLELDRVGGRPQRIARGAERESPSRTKIPSSRARSTTWGSSDVLSISARIVAASSSPTMSNSFPRKLPFAALQDEPHVLQVRFDVRVLEPLVQSVDERLRLLLHPAREPPFGRLEDELRALDHPAELRGEAARDDDLRDDSSGLELPVRLAFLHRHEVDRALHFGNHLLDVEALAADGERLGEAVEVDEGDTRAVARIADDEAHQHREDERVENEGREEGRRAAEDPEILREQEADRSHAKTSASGAFRNSSRGPSKTRAPSSRTTTRVAKCSTSSRFCVAKTTAPPLAHPGGQLPETAPLTGVEEQRGRLVEEKHLGPPEQRDPRGSAAAGCRRRGSRSAARHVGSSSSPMKRSVVPAGSGPISKRAKSSRFSRGERRRSGGALRHPADPSLGGSRSTTSRVLRSARGRPRGWRGASTCPRRSGR